MHATKIVTEDFAKIWKLAKLARDGKRHKYESLLSKQEIT